MTNANPKTARFSHTGKATRLTPDGKIDLNTVPSAMELRAASWREKADA